MLSQETWAQLAGEGEELSYCELRSLTTTQGQKVNELSHVHISFTAKVYSSHTYLQ